MSFGDILKKIDSEDPIVEVDKKNIIIAKDYKPQMVDEFINGKDRGETTHFDFIDKIFKWKKTYVGVWTGYGGHGKSELFKQLALVKSVFSGWKWAVFVHENMSYYKKQVTANNYFDGLIHTKLSRSPDKYYNNQPDIEDYKRAIDFISDHFIVIKLKHRTIDELLKYFKFVKDEYDIDGCLIDPWNKLRHDFIREDVYLADQFGIIKDFAIQNNVCFNIIAHPNSSNRYDKDGNLRMPNQNNLSGGAMWDNGMDFICSILKDDNSENELVTDCTFRTFKLKEHELLDSYPGEVKMSFEKNVRRYYINGINPLDMDIKKDDLPF